MGRVVGTDVGVARRAGMDARKALTATEHAAVSSEIGDRLLALPEMQRCPDLAAYVATGSEVDLHAAWAALAGRGARLHVPRIAGSELQGHAGETDPNRSMEFVAWTPGQALGVNRYGIGEPDGTAVPVAGLDAVVLPCVAIDDRGTRVGFGAGYYDRALAGLLHMPEHERPVLIGVAFDGQRREAIAARPWDVAVDVVLTEQVVLRPAGES